MRALCGQPRSGSLYLVCDAEASSKRGITPLHIVSNAAQSGFEIIQYRDKIANAAEYLENCTKMAAVCAETGTLLIANDHAHVASQLKLPVHLGQDDEVLPGLEVPYGRSTHNRGEIISALACDPKPAYLAIGTMFRSMVKPDIAPALNLLPELMSLTTLPIVLIGGINLENLRQLPRGERLFYAIITDALRYGTDRRALARYREDFERAVEIHDTGEAP